jgi:phosphoenolpyruvate synthase/pyruvate phosphate dikinase
MADQQSVRWFKDIGLADRPDVGGKGASLGELTRAGIQVPPGFVVPVPTFEAFLAMADPGGAGRATVAALDPSDISAIATAGEKIRERIIEAQMPRAIEMEIACAYREVCAGTDKVPVAVRSSATSEDSEDASFAGLQDTYLWVRGEDAVIGHVKRCWASLYNTESIAYRLRLKLPESEVAMAVVVQRMVMSRAAGVMFTRSPTTGDRSTIVIEGSWGFGSCLVSGEVTPDRFVVSKVTKDIGSRTTSQKLIRHVPDPSGVGVKVEDVPADMQLRPCLSDEEIAELTALGQRIERHYGRAQDIEWALTDEAAAPALYVLQSRPETVWSARDSAPIATPKSSALDHVLAALGRTKA